MEQLNGKVALVTGAARGIGAAIARRLAAAGATVIINYGSSEEAATNLASEIGNGAVTVKGDVSKRADHAAIRDRIARDFGGLDILVHNAGTGHPATLADMTEDHYDHIYGTNLKGVFFLTQALVPLLRHGGTIVNISSTTVVSRVFGLSAYSGSKAALEAMTRVWALELAPRHVTVNAVAPGLTDTDLVKNMPEVRGPIEEKHPYGRIGTPDEVASVVAFLAGPEARWVNGQTVTVNGGIA